LALSANAFLCYNSTMHKQKQHFGISTFPARLVFHIGGPDLPHHESQKPEQRETLPKPHGIPVNVESQPEKEKAQSVLENKDLFEAKNYDKNYGSYYLYEKADNKAPFRFLSFKHRNEYKNLPPAQRETYLKQHNTEIQANYLWDKKYSERVSPIMRAPKIRPSLLDRPELMVESQVFTLGGHISEGIAKNFRVPEGSKANINYVPGADPQTVLQNFEQQIKTVTPDSLQGASAVISFDPDLFGSAVPPEKHVEDTGKLLTRLNQLGIKVTVLSPLKVWNFEYKNRDLAYKNRNKYWEALCKFKDQGLVTSVVDLGDATQARDTMSTNKAFLSTNPSQLLNEKGNELAVNAAIMGINAANGYEAGNLSNEKYWPGGEDHELGTTTISGKPVERVNVGAPLKPEAERKAALEKVKPKDPLDPLKRLATNIMDETLFTASHDYLYAEYQNQRFIPGMYTHSYPAKRVVHEVFYALKAKKAAGEDVTEQTREFTRLASMVYVKLARIAIIHTRELFEDKSGQFLAYRKQAYEHAKKYIENAEKANKYYNLYGSQMTALNNEWDHFKQSKEFKSWEKSKG